MFPQEAVQCSDSTTLENVDLGLPCTLAITFDEKGDVLKYFEEATTEQMCCGNVCLNIIAIHT